MDPLVTVLIPAYNAEQTIGRALRSVFVQNYAPLEVIVVDDASTDGTRAAVEALNDPRITLVPLARNRGECGAMNVGLAAARGELVAFLDADDEWLPGKLAKQVDVIRHRPDMSFVNCGAIFIGADEATRLVSNVIPPPVADTEMWRPYLAQSCVAKPSVLARRSALRRAGRFDEGLKVAGDQDMWIRLALIGAVGHVHEPLIRVHDTAGSLTKRFARRECEFLLPMIKKHLAANVGRLSPAEHRSALGSRYSAVGRNLYRSGAHAAGFSYLARAVLLGHRPAENCWYLVTANRPAQHLKSLVRLLVAGRAPGGAMPLALP